MGPTDLDLDLDPTWMPRSFFLAAISVKDENEASIACQVEVEVEVEVEI